MASSEKTHRIKVLIAEEFREFIEKQHPDDYQLIDVRQLDEYGEKHLAGAVPVPVESLLQEIVALDKKKPTLIYCHQGALSQTAAKVLVRAGFEQVCCLDNGLLSWRYAVPNGSPADLYADLIQLKSAVEQAELAWQMEESARLFYLEMSKLIEDSDLASLFSELVVAEEQHKSTLKALWEALAGRPAEKGFFEVSSSEDKIMEGGLSLQEALAWARKSRPAEIVDYAMAMELNAYDQYLYLQRHSEDPDSQRLFEVMADEERYHLRALSKSFESLNKQI